MIGKTQLMRQPAGARVVTELGALVFALEKNVNLAAGSRLGAYEIVAPVGAGGMGEVYKARDTKLNRDVALKILPDAFSSDPERLSRFRREAHVLASLNHPHIGQIYGFEDSGATHALVMELVDGEDLSVTIGRGPIPIADALTVARQIADALEAAHDQGIVHRDLKPANIKVRADGTVKVLDFGLAKALDPGSASLSGERRGAATMSPTVTAATQLGVILGTAAYMAPEQARGKPVDKRADIWAFGVIVYEMITGRRAFAGDEISDVLAAVLRQDVDWSALPAATPPLMRRLLERCLDRDVKMRLRDIGEARVALASGDARASGIEATRRSSRWRVYAVAAAGVAVGALVAALASRRPVSAPAAPMRMLPLTVEGLDVTPDKAPVIAPDGRRIVYSAQGSLWIRELDRVEAQRVPDTDGAAGMFWSPDSRRIAFIRAGRLWTMPLGGKASSVAVLPGTPCGEPGGLWEPNGRLLLSLSCNVFPLFGVPDTGGDLVAALTVNKPAERDFHQLARLPNDAIVLTLDRADAGVDTLVAWDGRTRKTLLQLPKERLSSPVYSPTGHLIYQRTTTNPGIWAVSFSAPRLEVTGDPFLVVPGMAAPSIAGDGTLLVVPLAVTGNNQLVWIDRTGRIDTRIDEEHASMEQPRLSPDGRRVAFSDDTRNIVVRSLTDGTRTQITTGPALKWFPFWSPDGAYIYYSVEQPGRGNRLERQPSAGGGKAETIVDGARAGAITADGRWFAYSSSYSESGRKLFKMRLDGDRTPSLLFDTPGRATSVAISQDQRFIAYVIGDSTSEDGIYVRRFPDGEGQWQLDAARGDHARWSAKGDRLYFSRGNELWEIETRLGDTPTFGRARRLFAGADIRAWPTPYGYDVGADGRFLLVASRAQSVAPVMTLIENWQTPFTKASR